MADWTVEEARAYLPRLQHLLAVIRRSALVSARARSNGHGSALAAAGGDDTAAPTSDEEDRELAGVGPVEALAELEERGIVLRDVERGLVDFPSRHPQGKTVLLCWQIGEPDLGWWHLPEDGIAGRRPLPLPPEL